MRSGRKALILVGGANRGAYEAGIVQAIVEREGISDGQPIGYDMVSGTSIGALNAFLVATAQYTALRQLWQGAISSRNVFRLKHPYDQITDKNSGVGNRIGASVKLGTGITKDVAGVLDPAPVRAMLSEYIKASAPVHLPLYISTTNLTLQVNQTFERRATTDLGLQKQATNDQLLKAYPGVTRPAQDALLQDIMFASACLPMMFDPITIPREDGSGKIDQYVDGGVTSNIPVRIAQLCVEQLHVVLLNTKVVPEVHFASAAEVGMGVFNTMQWNIIQYQVRLAYEAGTKDLPFTPFIIRPGAPLPGKASDFNDQPSLTAMWNQGYADGKQGWVPFVPPAGLFLTPY